MNTRTPGADTPQDEAISAVIDYVERAREKTDAPYSPYDVYVVWYAYILGGWKALVSTSLPDRHYYEVTSNARTGELYLDVYVKVHNEVAAVDPLKQARVKDGERPHSRACGLTPHDHGSGCKPDCPTCHGQESDRDAQQLREAAGPHSRTCVRAWHPHGDSCHPTCPTCQEKESDRD